MGLSPVKFTKPLAHVEREINKIIAALNENQIASGIGYRMKRTAHGTGLDIEMPKVEAGVASAIKQYRLVSVQNDYVTAEEWNGSTAGDQVKIAKPYHLRKTPFHNQTIQVTIPDTISGPQTYNLTFNQTAESFRIVTVTSANFSLTERQIPIPLYRAGDLLYATEPDNGTGAKDESAAGITWLDLNVDGRAWARKQ